MKHRQVNCNSISENFNENECKNTLKESYIFAVCESDKIKQQIDDILKDIDPVELLSHISLCSQFIPEGEPESNQDLRDKPTLHFLAGLCLKSESLGNRHPDNQEVGKIIELLDKYFSYFSVGITFQGVEREQGSEVSELILLARLQKMISQINPEGYRFQIESLLRSVFGKFDDYFVGKVGFTISDALDFEQKIAGRYVRLLNERRLDKAGETREMAEQELKDPITGHQLREFLKKEENEKEFLESCFIYLMFTRTQEIFVFDVNAFCKDEGIKECEKFEKYLKALSCKFGEGNERFESPLDENIIITKPIVNIGGGKYFCPIPQDLIFKLSIIFESFLDDEKQKQTRIWHKYKDTKAKYIENRVYESLSRLFPEQHIFKNLKYTYQGKECEVDALVLYDNKIFIIESKAGAFTEPAKRGAIKRLETDLKKLIEEAYQQGRRTRDYIKSAKHAIFKDKTGRKILEIKFNPHKIDFFLINVTLEPLMSFGSGLKRLQSLGLFAENEYPWSVNLFELDLVTRHIPSKTIFIHYLERRLAAQDEDIFHSFDELSFFSWYLENGNFYVPLTDDSRTPNIVSLDGSCAAIFDDHYLHGKKAPELKIEPELVKIIRILEILHPVGHSDIASALLDFDHKARELILKNINKLIERTKKDHMKHDCTVLYKDALDMGFTFMTQCGREELRERLGFYCALKKYQTKTKRWIGIGRDALDDEWLVNEFFYLDILWKSDPKMDELLIEFPFKEGLDFKKAPTSHLLKLNRKISAR